MNDRPIGPVYESRFTASCVPVHVLVVRGEAEHLELARDSATELLALWCGAHGDVARVAGRPGEWVDVRPETIALLSLAEPPAARLDVDAAEGRARLQLGDRLDLSGVERGLVADIVARDVADAGALGVCVNVDGDVRVDGVPPRPAGWSVELGAHRDGRIDDALLLPEGAVAVRGDGVQGLRATVWAPTAWNAAVVAAACARCDDIDAALAELDRRGARGQVVDPWGIARASAGWERPDAHELGHVLRVVGGGL